jgi:hypothetical protein
LDEVVEWTSQGVFAFVTPDILEPKTASSTAELDQSESYSSEETEDPGGLRDWLLVGSRHGQYIPRE